MQCLPLPPRLTSKRHSKGRNLLDRPRLQVAGTFDAVEAHAALLGSTQPLPAQLLLLIVQLGGSDLVIFNRRAWLGAGALGAFTLIITLHIVPSTPSHLPP
jgi:hypothetical protein